MKRTGTNAGPCRDCGVEVGQPHEDGCDVARCLWTGGQRLSCSGWVAPIMQFLLDAGQQGMADELGEYLEIEADHDCGNDIWSGVWPGVEDAERFGWWARFSAGEGWVRCDEDHPEATADLNRLYGIETVWDRETHRWELAPA